MAIETMKRVAAIVPADVMGDFTSWLHGKSVIHLARLREELPLNYAPCGLSGEKTREKTAKLEQIMAFCEAWGGAKKSFLENIFSAKTTARMKELKAAAEETDIGKLNEQVTGLRQRRDVVIERAGAIEKEIERLKPFAETPVLLASLGRLKNVKVSLIRLGRRAQEEIAVSAGERLAWEKLAGELFWAAYPANDEETEAYLNSLGAIREEIPQVEAPVKERLAVLAEEKAKNAKETAKLDKESREFAKNGAKIELALGYWQSEMHQAEGLEKVVASKRLGVAHGYVPARELENFRAEVAAKYEGEVLAEDPKPEEDVPVKITTGRFMKPARLLVNMFGVPLYNSIDPTPFLALVFLAFFGICYSDAVYGIMLIIISWLLRRRFRYNEGLKNFFTLFIYGGVSTFIFGALLGSWAANLSDFLPPGNILAKIRGWVPSFDPLGKPIIALVITIGIGVANQYFGLVMRMWRDWRRGDKAGAVCDGGLWFFYLTGVIILVSTMFTEVPALAVKIAVWLLIIGAIGLVLTQGRTEKTLFAKFLVGVVSLYGIMGSYGVTSFVGDVLSYSRLLALGLTTGIVGMSFNILADILSKVPSIGLALFIGMVIFGHTFNFMMSIIGAFVHSARLILLEFFGRFYEVGGLRYEPFGFRSERVELIEN
jgi:V/A-type H+-transporting ATPase subunit I